MRPGWRRPERKRRACIGDECEHTVPRTVCSHSLARFGTRARKAAAMPLHVWSSDHFTLELPQGHAFPVAKYAPLRERLVERGIVAREHVHASQPAPISWLASVHADDYIDRVLAGSLSTIEQQRLGL